MTVTSYEQGSETTTRRRCCLEHVALNFSKVQISYTPVAGPPLVTAGWDVQLDQARLETELRSQGSSTRSIWAFWSLPA